MGICNIQDLLEGIAKADLNNGNIEETRELCNGIREYYSSSEYGRHSYSEVSTFIYNMEEGDFEYLINNLVKISEYCKENKEYEKYVLNVKKLIDHISLEINRISFLQKKQRENMMGILKNSLDVTKSLQENVSKINNNFEAQEKQIDSWYANVISILGIFAAIVIAFFGGMSILGSALNNMHTVSKYRLSFVIIITGFVTFNIIFMLLYIISKLVGKSITPECSRVCKNYDNRFKLKCFKERYPIVYWYNILTVVFVVFDFGLFIIDKYNIITYWFTLESKVDYSKVGSIGIEFLCAIIILAIVMLFIRTRDIKNCNIIKNHNIIKKVKNAIWKKNKNDDKVQNKGIDSKEDNGNFINNQCKESYKS